MATENTSIAPKALVEQGYDAVAEPYHAWMGARVNTTRSEYLDTLYTHLPKNAKVLELGCGAGVPVTQNLVAQGYDVTGVDISSAQVDLGRKHVPEATFIHSDMMSLSFEPGTFDAIVAFYSIFHLPKDEQGQMIGKISGWLKNGGWALFNLHFDEGDTSRENWIKPGVTMFSSGLGVEGNKEMLRKDGAALKFVVDEVQVEKVGKAEEKFHWAMGVKEASNSTN